MRGPDAFSSVREGGRSGGAGWGATGPWADVLNLCFVSVEWTQAPDLNGSSILAHWSNRGFDGGGDGGCDAIDAHWHCDLRLLGLLYPGGWTRGLGDRLRNSRPTGVQGVSCHALASNMSRPRGLDDVTLGTLPSVPSPPCRSDPDW